MAQHKINNFLLNQCEMSVMKGNAGNFSKPIRRGSKIALPPEELNHPERIAMLPYCEKGKDIEVVLVLHFFSLLSENIRIFKYPVFRNNIFLS